MDSHANAWGHRAAGVRVGIHPHSIPSIRKCGDSCTVHIHGHLVDIFFCGPPMICTDLLRAFSSAEMALGIYRPQPLVSPVERGRIAWKHIRNTNLPISAIARCVPG